MKYLFFIFISFIALSACSKEEVDELQITRSDEQTDSISDESIGITLSCDTTWKGVIDYNF